MSKSRFDELIEHRGRAPVDICDTCLMETDNFIAVPSKGALVPGWVLVLPKRHVFTLTQLKSEEWIELKTIVPLLSEMLVKTFRPITIFEHGAISENSAIGCGVEHAHLHLVPLAFDIVEEVQKKANLIWDAIPMWYTLEELPPPNHDYLMASGPTGATILARHPPQTSQFFRKIIAQKLELKNCWDYRSHPFHGNVAATISACQSWPQSLN